jgi:hypothetical protein
MYEVVFRGVIPVFRDPHIADSPGVPPPKPPLMARTYDPFETETALFLVFAATRTKNPWAEKGDIQKFAVSYGLVADSYFDWKIRLEEMETRVHAWRNGDEVDLFALVGEPLTVYCDGSKTIIESNDLWACLRLQFNLAVTNKLDFQDCAQCGKPFAIIPPATRSNRVYCSTACSSAAYRERKKQKGAKKDVTPTKQPKKKGTRRGRSKKDE